MIATPSLFYPRHQACSWCRGILILPLPIGRKRAEYRLPVTQEKGEQAAKKLRNLKPMIKRLTKERRWELSVMGWGNLPSGSTSQTRLCILIEKRKPMQLRIPIKYINYLPRKNLTRINYSFLAVMGGMFVYGLLLPTDWEQRFGIFAQPIIWATHFVPSIGKFAAASTIPELINGFLGLAAYISLLHGVYVFRWAFFDCSQGNGVRLILKSPNYSLIILIFLWVFAVFVLSVFYVMPFSVNSLCGGITWGSRTCASMLESPFSLILYGSMATAGLSAFSVGSVGCIVRTFGLLIQGDDEDGSNNN